MEREFKPVYITLCSLNCVALCIAKTIINSKNEMLFCFSFLFFYLLNLSNWGIETKELMARLAAE